MSRKTEIIDIAKTYKLQKDWRTNHWADYVYAKRNGFLEECTSHMNTIIRWTEQSIIESVSGYDYFSDWRRDNQGAYAYARSHKILKTVKSLLHVKKHENNYLTLDQCRAIARDFKTSKEWRMKDGKSYGYAKAKKWLLMCTEHMASSKIKWTIERCMDISIKYNTRVEWAKENNGSYQSAIRNNWLDFCTSHMEESATEKWDIEKLQYELIKLFGNSIIVDKSSYTSMRNKCWFIDEKYGKYLAKPTKVICDYKMHPSRLANNSKAEKEIAAFIQSLGLNALPNHKMTHNGKTIELDVFVPTFNLGIEFNGLYWHSELHKPHNYHFNKRKFCEKLGITLIQIQEDEWKYKRAICESILKNALDRTPHRIMARKTQIKEISYDEASKFLNANHLMGAIKCKNIGLFYEEKIVAIMGYKKTGTGVNIERFCNAINHNIIGGLSKLFKYIENMNMYNFIQSFVDLRYGTGKSLLQLGFLEESVTLGWMWTDKNRTFNRRQCRANMDNRHLSEKEYAHELGWYKIYDAGQAKFIKKLLIK